MTKVNNISRRKIPKSQHLKRNPSQLEFLESEGYELVPHKSTSKYDIRTRENNRPLGYLEVNRRGYEVTILYNNENLQQIEDALKLRDICESISISYHSSISKKELADLIRNNFGNNNSVLRRL